ncbi:Calcium activated potassium channel subunit [Schistosoma japonicum]|nr:Calcium activated potassium channel subunit [Schistosoma japonicum]
MHNSTSKSKEDCLNDKDNEQEVNIVKHDTLQPSHNNQQYNYHFSHSQPHSNLNYYSNHTLHSHQSFHHLHKHLPPPSHQHHQHHHYSHTVWRVRQHTYRETCIKIIYLTCATIITTCFIIECILIHLVILPCRHEAGFLPTNCTYIDSKLISSSVKCENKCSKDRSSFQCIRILIAYSRLKENFTASLFDNIATYQYYHSLGCATSSCHRQNSANHEWVQHFCQLIKNTVQFTCYVHEDHINEALLHKFYGPETMFNTLFWPLILLLISGLCLLITWFFDKCHVWHDEKPIIA